MTQNRYLEKLEQPKRRSLDSSLMEYMDSNKCVEELLKQLEEERRNVRREKLAVARLQREVARSRSEGTMREKLIQELEEERRLRLESDKRLREVAEESELGRVQMVSLQHHFSRMEDTVRTLLQSQGVLDHTAVDTVDIIKAYKDKLSEETQKQKESLEEARPTEDPNRLGDASDADMCKDQTNLLLERLQVLEAENSALVLENENQRKQYERCLDEVANQVVQALLTQKDLREECLKLRTRVFDLEQQNRTLSAVFQQRVRPASDLLLQKLHSRIWGLSSGDLLLEMERNRGVPLSRNADSPPHQLQLSGRAGLPVKYRSQLSLTVPAAAYPRSSRSSSELSLSSVCSECSSGSYTWNDGQSSSRLSSLTWDKRMSLGSSAPGNIWGACEEELPTCRKERHILAGLKRLQKRGPKEPSSLNAKPGYKDCMNSNEGIYSLGMKCGAQSMAKPPVTGCLGVRRKMFASDSDEADDESPRGPAQLHGVCSKDSWEFLKKSSLSVSDSLCSWDEGLDCKPSDGKCLPGYRPKEVAEKLTSFTAGLSDGTTHNPSLVDLRVSSTEVSSSLHLSDTDDFEDSMVESGSSHLALSCPAERLERDPEMRGLHTDRTKPRPLSQILLPKGADNHVTVIFDAEDGEPIQLNSQQPTAVTHGHLPGGGLRDMPTAECLSLVSETRPESQIGRCAGNDAISESPAMPARLQTHSTAGNGSSLQGQSADSPSENLLKFSAQQQKLIKPPHSQSPKIHSATAMHSVCAAKAHLTKIPGHRKGPPERLGMNCSSSLLGPAAKDRSPVSPPVKLSRFVKSPGGSQAQSPKGAQYSSKVPSKNDWGKGFSSGIPGSPPPSGKQLEQDDIRELPTRDQHCGSGQTTLRSPSPPPPPGRSTSLLIRPNYNNSPHALKLEAQPPAPSTVRGAPSGPQKHPPPPLSALNLQHSDAHAGQGAADFDASLVEVTLQKLVNSQHLPKAATLCQTPTKGSPKRVPPQPSHSTASDYSPELSESACKASKNIPALLTSPKDTVQGLFSGKKGQSLENGHPVLYKASSSLPLSLDGHHPGLTEEGGILVDAPKMLLSCSGSESEKPSSAERASKTRIPVGFKAFMKSPSLLRKSSTVPGKQEKERVAGNGEVTAVSKPSGAPQRNAAVDTATRKPQLEASSPADGALPPQVSADSSLGCSGDSCLFKRSVSVTTRPYLKPALGMNGAKARSQSFSTHYMEKPCLNVPEGAEKVRTQIITNTGERGNSLSRQGPSTLGVGLKAHGGARESRLDSHGAPSSPGTHPAIPGRSSSLSCPGKDTAKGDADMLVPQKEACGLSHADKFGHKASRPSGKVLSHLEFESPSSSGHGPDLKVEASGSKLLSPRKADVVKSGKKAFPTKGQEEAKKHTNPSACSIEEKVMQGIVENVQKGQSHDRAQAPEAKPKSGSSLANWFGFRRSKLPALNGKKTDVLKEKTEKKELKLGTVLGGRHTKSDKKKDKNKMERRCRESPTRVGDGSDNARPAEVGQPLRQAQCPPTHSATEEFGMERLNGNVAQSDSHGASLPGTAIISQGAATETGEMKKDSEISYDSAKIKLHAGNDEDPAPESAGRDHFTGSSCQMRTLDSGIGTFPLPESIARVPGRHLPKTEFCPRRASGHPTEPSQDLPLPSLPKSKVPSCSASCLSHSMSTPSMPGTSVKNSMGWTPSTAAPGAVIPGRLSQAVRSPGPEDCDKTGEAGGGNLGFSLTADRAQRVCLYSGSSSDGETELDPEGSMLNPRHSYPQEKTKNRTQGDRDQLVTNTTTVEIHFSIMDYYQQDLFVLYDKDRRSEEDAGDCSASMTQPREVTHEDPKPGFVTTRLESLNERNSSGRMLRHREHGKGDVGANRDRPGPGRATGCSHKPNGENVGSLSDSLYDSFSSCTSQSSGDT